jgi:hypothetical protein
MQGHAKLRCYVFVYRYPSINACCFSRVVKRRCLRRAREFPVPYKDCATVRCRPHRVIEQPASQRQRGTSRGRFRPAEIDPSRHTCDEPAGPLRLDSGSNVRHSVGFLPASKLSELFLSNQTRAVPLVGIVLRAVAFDLRDPLSGDGITMISRRTRVCGIEPPPSSAGLGALISLR